MTNALRRLPLLRIAAWTIALPACGGDGGGAGPGADAGTDADADADTDTDADADTDADSDADGGADAAVSCGEGVAIWGICWYLGSAGMSCLGVCDLHGGYAEGTPAHVGTTQQGGSPSDCHEIFDALGYDAGVSIGLRPDDLGLGCHRWSDGVQWWLQDPAFDPEDSAPPARLACGCLGAAD